MIHGFAGDIEEVRPLRDYLMSRGYEVACPLLPGHGQTKQELKGANYIEWIDSVESAYLKLSGKYGKVIVIGFSMGGLLAVNLWHYGFSGLVTVNTPVYYWNPRRITENLLADFRNSGRRYWKASTDKPLSALLEFQKLLSKTKPQFENITCKTLVVQALDDDTVYHRSADYISKKVRADKFLYKYPEGGHMIFQSKSKDAVCGVIETFIRAC